MAHGLPVCNAIKMPSSNYIKFNEADLEILFKENFKPLCAYCQYKFGFETDVAKEAVHTGFIKLWENRETISSDLTVKAYLYKIVSNISLDMLKHEKVKEKHAMQVSKNPSLNISGKDFHEVELKQLEFDVNKAVSELPEQMRKIFELSRYEGLKYMEIAAQLNISVKTVETQMSRALLKLRQKLSHYLIITIIAFLLNQ
jgi:RNA polymerase sigma-70 factor (ECF subfamily)